MVEMVCSGCNEVKHITKKFRITRLPMYDDCVKILVDEHLNSILEINWEEENNANKQNSNS